MTRESDIFEKNYKDYCGQIADLDFGARRERLGIKMTGNNLIIPFLGDDYTISGNGIQDASGERPNYIICVILSKYLLLAPDRPVHDPEWISIKDFKQTSKFTNVNYHISDTEKPIIERFSGGVEELRRACERLGGTVEDLGTDHDLVFRFSALPKISLLLLFNDRDEEFPAQCTVLFQKQAEHYLDPESLLMVGALLAKRLTGI
jgi:hypothetical protein